jgi:hypothetical protein
MCLGMCVINGEVTGGCRISRKGNSIIFIACQMVLGWWNQDREVEEAWEKKHKGICLEKCEGKNNSEELVMNGRMALKLISKKWDVEVWTGLTCLWIGTSRWYLSDSNESSAYIKVAEFFHLLVHYWLLRKVLFNGVDHFRGKNTFRFTIVYLDELTDVLNVFYFPTSPNKNITANLQVGPL